MARGTFQHLRTCCCIGPSLFQAAQAPSDLVSRLQQLTNKMHRTGAAGLPRTMQPLPQTLQRGQYQPSVVCFILGLIFFVVGSSLISSVTVTQLAQHHILLNSRWGPRKNPFSNNDAQIEAAGPAPTGQQERPAQAPDRTRSQTLLAITQELTDQQKWQRYQTAERTTAQQLSRPAVQENDEQLEELLQVGAFGTAADDEWFRTTFRQKQTDVDQPKPPMWEQKQRINILQGSHQN